MSEPSNRRAHERRVPLAPLILLDPTTKEPVGSILDLSMGGAKARLHGCTGGGAPEAICIDLPADFEEVTYLELPVSVRWQRGPNAEGVSEYGIAFRESLPLDQMLLLGRLVDLHTV
ncbi:MAG: PilZ domain-containing protein [Planctomycetes bacterium]|nr:PilZ domain-containing protein [Planctomycetota bacterium]